MHSPDFLARIRGFDPEILLLEALAHPWGAYTGFEHLAVAVARQVAHGTSEPTNDEVLEILQRADADLARYSASLGPFQRMMLNVRGIRPSWFSGPLYSELLRSFDPAVRNLFGYSVDEIFEAAAGRDYLKEGTVREGGFVPEPLEPFWDSISLSWRDCQDHQVLFSKACILLDDGRALVMPSKVADTIYLHICKTLQADDKHFGRKKGDALESFVHVRLKRLAPYWKWNHKYWLCGNDAEKDHLGHNGTAGIAVESKSLKIRDATFAFSEKNVARDLKELKKAIRQLTPVLRSMQDGICISDGVAQINLPQMAYWMGMVVTDNPYTPYVRAIADNFLENEDGDLWHGDNVHLVSFIDLELLASFCGAGSILIDYFRRIRSQPQFRWSDEPECLLAYGLDPLVQIGTVASNIDLRGFDWTKVKTGGGAAVRPVWLTRHREVIAAERANRMDFAFRILDQDQRKMAGWAKSLLSRE